MNLFHLHETVLSSGRRSDWKVECDVLIKADWDWAAWVIAHQADFSEVEGVPTGGLPLAAALERYRLTGGLLIVDDVLTTGQSMEKQRAGRPATGFVLFARGPLPSWIQAVWKEGRVGVKHDTE